MKKLMVAFLYLCSLSLGAQDVSYISPAPYTVVSDVFTNDLLSGEVRVKGLVLLLDGTPLAGTLISTIDDRVSTMTDSTGAYEFIIHNTDTSIYMYKQGYNEVAMDFYNFRSGHTVEVNFMPRVAGISLPDDNFEMYPVSFKPVIYLYATATMKVSLSLDYLGDLTFTYPEYNQGWNVILNDAGIHATDYSKAYPYLFWEGNMGQNLTYLKEEGELIGQFVKTDTLVPFLESQLSAMGLTRTEQTDFITFWAPRMINKDYVFIQFLLDDLYASNVAGLEVSPCPDAQRRLYLLFTGFNDLPVIETTPQKFEPFERKGFTLIEWGGSELLSLQSI